MWAELAGVTIMVKYRPALMESTGERLARFAWDSQDGGLHKAEHRGESSTHRSNTEELRTGSSVVSPLPLSPSRRHRGLRRGLDDLPQRNQADLEPLGEDTELSLKQIMEAIHTC